MKVPASKEEFLVWPPLGGGVGIIVGATVFDVLTTYQTLLKEHEGAYWFAGYVFPILMGVAFAVRLHGKYWLGFGWLAFVSYLASLILHWLPIMGSQLHLEASSMFANVYLVLVALSILFAVQSGSLLCKRLTINKSDP